MQCTIKILSQSSSKNNLDPTFCNLNLPLCHLMTSWVMRNLEHIKLQFCPKIIIGPAVCSMEPKWHGLINKLYSVQDRKLSDAKYLQTRENIFRAWELDQLSLPRGWKFRHSDVDKVGSLVVKDHNLFNWAGLDLVAFHFHHWLPASGLKQILQVLLVHRHWTHLIPNGLVTWKIEFFVFSPLLCLIFNCQALAQNPLG